MTQQSSERSRRRSENNERQPMLGTSSQRIMIRVIIILILIIIAALLFSCAKVEQPLTVDQPLLVKTGSENTHQKPVSPRDLLSFTVIGMSGSVADSVYVVVVHSGGEQGFILHRNLVLYLRPHDADNETYYIDVREALGLPGGLSLEAIAVAIRDGHTIVQIQRSDLYSRLRGVVGYIYSDDIIIK